MLFYIDHLLTTRVFMRSYHFEMDYTSLDFKENKALFADELFLAAYPSELSRLVKHVTRRNAELYNIAEFKLLFDLEDRHLIIGETPDLGEGQLGVFAGKKYYAGQRVALYQGKVICEKSKSDIVQQFCEQYKGIDDYIWQVECGDGDSIAICACLTGTLARFINDATNPNVEMKYIDGLYYVAKRDINFGEEITASYGPQYFRDLNSKEIKYIPRTHSDLKTSIKNITNIKLTQLKQLMSMHDSNFNQDSMPEHVEIIKKNEQVNPNKNLYIDNKNKPLIFFFDKAKEKNQQHLERLQSITEKTIEMTSQYKLIIAPLVFDLLGNRIFELFAGEEIPKGKTVCLISGDRFEKDEIDKLNTLDPNELFAFPSHFIYVKDKSSEASFIQGSSHNDYVNVKIIGNRFVTTRTIKYGEPILANFGLSYKSDFSGFHFKDVAIDFNMSQNNHVLKYGMLDSVNAYYLQSNSVSKKRNHSEIERFFQPNKNQKLVCESLAGSDCIIRIKKVATTDAIPPVVDNEGAPSHVEQEPIIRSLHQQIVFFNHIESSQQSSIESTPKRNGSISMLLNPE